MAIQKLPNIISWDVMILKIFSDRKTDEFSFGLAISKLKLPN